MREAVEVRDLSQRSHDDRYFFIGQINAEHGREDSTLAPDYRR
jgi:hypothetical protein